MGGPRHREDMQQEVFLRFYSGNFRARLAEIPEEGRAGYVVVMARRVCATYLKEEKRQTLVVPLDAKDRSAIRDLMAQLLAGEPLAADSCPDIPWIEETLDGLAPETLGRLRGILSGDTSGLSDTERQWHRRLVASVQERVNQLRRQATQEHDGPGSRRAVSNASALASLRQDEP